MTKQLRIVICGLSVTSSWGNGHASTYRSLMRGLATLGHEVWFLERNQAWYAHNRDLPVPPYGHACLYSTIADLKKNFSQVVREADLVILGSYVPEGIELGQWILSTARGVTAFYDIDTPITLGKMLSGECDYISKELAPRFDLYLSFTGGPLLHQIEKELGVTRALPLYCSVDPLQYGLQRSDAQWDLGYMGTYSADRQPWLEETLIGPARDWKKGRFVVAGAQYPEHYQWPENVERIVHLPPTQHPDFYGRQLFTLNITRVEMRAVGYSPSVRLFEAACCGTPIITDEWEGLTEFFAVGKEILTARSGKQVLEYLQDIPDKRRTMLGANARERVLRQHTGIQRAATLVSYVADFSERRTALSMREASARPADGEISSVASV